MRLGLFWFVGVSVAVAGCRLHTLQDGAYEFRVTEVLRDECQLTSEPQLVTRGTLVTVGHLVRLNYAYLDTEFAGTYRYGLEEMTMDATLANVRTRLRGRECQLETVMAALDSVTQSPTRFVGQLSFQFASRADDACNCRVFFRYEANRAGGP